MKQQLIGMDAVPGGANAGDGEDDESKDDAA
jgi:hypothetical protein